MYEDKDFVALDCCIECGEPKGIAIDKRLEKTLPRNVCTSIDLCENCLKKAKEEGWFVMYEVEGTEQLKKAKTYRKKNEITF